MLSYIIKRMLIFIPTLVIISLLGFIISVNAPGDPVERVVNTSGQGDALGGKGQSSQEVKTQVRKRLNLHLPIFYFSLASLAAPDTLYRIPDHDRRAMLNKMVHKNGNWPEIAAYFRSVQQALQKQANMKLNPDNINKYSRNRVNKALNTSRFTLLRLLEETDDKQITAHFESLNKLYARFGFFEPMRKSLQNMKRAYLGLISNPQEWKTYVPAFNWYGLANQYHEWLTGIVFDLDFGRSYRNQQPVMDRIEDRFLWSFSLSILSILIAYIVSIPTGIYAAYRRNSFFDRASGFTLFALISLPSFFVGTLLLFLFANPDMLVWFPEAGVKTAGVFQESWPWWRKLQHHAPYLVLPLITYTYSSFAFLSRQMRIGMLDVINQDYIQTARAKGLSERVVVLKHALKNGLLPIITLFSNVFPLALGGSVIIENIFSIPGMGREIYLAILNADYPMIVAIFTLVGFLTVIGYLVADILYAVVDPRITYR